MSTSSTAALPLGERDEVVVARRPLLVLGVVLLATFLINLDTTIVNVAIPALSRELHSSTSGLQWVIDAYNIAFAGLILTGGTIGDRYGRRRTLVAGLLVFAIGTGLAATSSGTGVLIGWRVLMGAAAAFVFPTTLSIISQTFVGRAERARAIGAWGASTGAAVALGPIVGGALLAHFSWTSVFLAMVPVAGLAALGALAIIPSDSARPGTPLDLRGLVISAAALVVLVYTIIEAPTRGWSSPATVGGLVLASAGLATLVLVERREAHPMLDVRLFANLRFTAASAAVTTAFFALFGFTFLIIVYFQTMRGYSALGAGVRILPVAVSLAVASGLGTVLAVKIGNKAVVAAGLVLTAAGYAWVAGVQSETTSYAVIVLQMILLGSGMGFSTAPATEAILGVVRPEQAGVGSAVNDATRLVGGTPRGRRGREHLRQPVPRQAGRRRPPPRRRRCRGFELRRQPDRGRAPARLARPAAPRASRQRLPRRVARRLRGRRGRLSAGCSGGAGLPACPPRARSPGAVNATPDAAVGTITVARSVIDTWELLQEVTEIADWYDD